MEATVVCIDNSEWTRNGDYSPNRFQAQADAVNLLAGAKTETNPENTVGVMTMAGKTPRVLVTPSQDLGRILNAMQMVEVEGESNLARSVQIAQLALKHRKNKHQRQRIVLFVGSPIAEDKDSLVKIAKKLKKNNVAVDVVSLAAEEENTPKLEAFQEAVNSGDNSHLVLVPAGTVLSDNLFGTPIFQGEGYDFGGGAGGEDGNAAEGGFAVDPNLDPELALALRVSLEEERARQEQAQAAAGGTNAAEGGAQEATTDAGDAQMAEAPASTPAAAPASTPASTPASAPATQPAPQPASIAADTAVPMEEDEDDLLQQALAMSMAEDQGAQEAGTGPSEPIDASMFDSYDEELQNAINMSMSQVQPGEQASEDEKLKQNASDTVNQLIDDPEFAASVVSSLPGVDANDPQIQAVLEELSNKGNKEPDSKDKKTDNTSSKK